MRQLTVLILSVAALALVAACGNEPPMPGELAITSTPTGAAITQNGVETGLETPAVISDLDGGSYTIGVALDGVTFRPDHKDVTVAWGERSSVDFQTDAGIFVVDSTPAGARVILDGADSGEVTPFTFVGLDPGPHTVDVVLAHHRSTQGPQTFMAVANEETDIDLELVIQPVVLFEGFSNVRCAGCPQLALDVETVLHDLHYGPDRFLYVKYAGSNPFFFDPMFQDNMDMVNDRINYYTGLPGMALPTLYMQGVLSGTFGSPADDVAMAASIDEGNLADIDFYLTVTAQDLQDLDERDVACDIVVHAPYSAVDLSDYSLRAVVLYEEVETEEHYEPGGDEYHWVARDDAEVAASIGAIDQGGTASFSITLNDPDPGDDLTPHGREVIVFAQHNTTKFVIQAGSTMLAAEALPLPVQSGGIR